MPILLDLKDHNILGPTYRKGRREGERRLVSRMIVKRFGALPTSLAKRLGTMSPAAIEKLSDRLLTASTLEDLFI